MSITIDEQIIYELMNTVALSMEIEQKTRFFGTSIPLSKTEIHLITTVAENPGIHKIGIASKMEITKGAVTQISKKLCAANLLKFELDPHNQSRHLLFVTPEGQKAHENHIRFHKIINNQCLSNIEPLSESVKEQFLAFFKSIQDDIEKISDKF